MRVVHVNASDSRGGAAMAAYRLHRALRQGGVDSRYLTTHKATNDDSVELLEPMCEPDPESIRHVDAIRSAYIERNRTSISNTLFSLSLLGLDLSQHSTVRAADIVHLHWIASMQTPTTIGRLLRLGKPIVWTLHDLNPFTGGCHFPAGCRQFEASCSGCSQLHDDKFGLPAAALHDKQVLWSLDHLTVLAPSRWMAQRAKNSALFRRCPRMEVIPNGVDTQVFRPQPRDAARRVFDIPPEGFCLLFGADQMEENRKGFSALARALTECAQDPRFRAAGGRFLCLGETPPCLAETDLPLIQLGRIDQEERMAMAYAAADLFVLPSTEDNLPNMVLESLACGTPVVAFSVGGIPEIVVDGVNGMLFPVGHTSAMAQGILALMADPRRLGDMGESGGELVRQRYSHSALCTGHERLYNELQASQQVRNSFPEMSQKQPLKPSHEFSPHAANSKVDDPGPNVGELLPRLTIHCLTSHTQYLEWESAQRLTVIEDLIGHLRRSQEDCSDRLTLINDLSAHLRRSQKDCSDRLALINDLSAHSRRPKQPRTPMRRLKGLVAAFSTLWRSRMRTWKETMEPNHVHQKRSPAK